MKVRPGACPLCAFPHREDQPVSLVWGGPAREAYTRFRLDISIFLMCQIPSYLQVLTCAVSSARITLSPSPGELLLPFQVCTKIFPEALSLIFSVPFDISKLCSLSSPSCRAVTVSVVFLAVPQCLVPCKCSVNIGWTIEETCCLEEALFTFIRQESGTAFWRRG